MTKKSLRKKKSGFSLIELSIVLIILGLLIAGVTGGATLIKNAELRSASVEANTLKSGIASFIAKYESYPGDFNGNIIVGAAAASFASGPAAKPQTSTAANSYYPNANDVIEAENCEGVVAFVDISNVGAGGFIPYLPGGNAINVASATCNTALAYNLPATTATGTNVSSTLQPSKIKAAGWTFDGATEASSILMTDDGAGAATSTTVSGRNYAVLTGQIPAGAAMTTASSILKSNAGGQTRAYGAISPTDAQSIDLKVDDGRPSSGTVVSFSATAPGVTFAYNTCFDRDGATSTVIYKTATKAKTCAMAFNVDVR